MVLVSFRDHKHVRAQMNGVDRLTWILALNGDGVFSPAFAAEIEAIGWRWVTLPGARGRLPGARSRRLALLAVDHFTAATYDLIHFVADVLDLPIIVFSPAPSLCNVCESLHAGADDFISIPYVPEEAIARLNSVLNGRYRITARTPRSRHLPIRRHLRVVRRPVDPNRNGRIDASGERR